MDIQVMRLSEKEPLAFRVELSDTIAAVKTLLHERFGIMPSLQKLIYRKKELCNDNCTVDDCGLSQGALLVLLTITPEPEPSKEIVIEVNVASHEDMTKQLEEELLRRGLNHTEIDEASHDLVVVLGNGEVLDRSASEELFNRDELPPDARVRVTFKLQEPGAKQPAKQLAAKPEVQQHDRILKLMLVGDSGVGKSNFLLRYGDNTFTDTHISTIGVDFKIKTIESSGNRSKLQIWDTAGEERFRTICNAYYRGADCIIIMYDVCDRETFDNVGKWLDEASKHGKQKVHKVLVGNKCDMEAGRKVSSKEGRKKAEELGIAFMEASAKKSTNVEAVFQMIAEEIL